MMPRRDSPIVCPECAKKDAAFVKKSGQGRVIGGMIAKLSERAVRHRFSSRHPMPDSAAVTGGCHPVLENYIVMEKKQDNVTQVNANHESWRV